MATSQLSASPGLNAPRATGVLMVALLIGAAVVARLVSVATAQLAYPHDLGYESSNLATIQLLTAGQKIYDRTTFDAGPFVLTMYTPLYHRLVAWLPTVEDRPFLAGRMVSLSCLLATAGLLFLVGRPTRPIWLPLLAVAAMFSIRPLVVFAAYLRIDSLGLLLATAALICLGQTSRTRTQVALAALLAAGAFFTKQTFLTGGLSCGLFLLLNNPRHAALFAAVYVAAVVVGFIACFAWQGESGVWFCWFVAPRNPLRAEILLRNAQEMLAQPVFLLLLLGAAVTSVQRLCQEGWRVLGESPYLLQLGLAAGAVLATTAKVGSSTNSYFELVLAALLWLIHAWRHVSLASLAQPWPLLTALAFALGMACELAFAERLDTLVRPELQREVERQLALFRPQLAPLLTPQTRLLNLTDYRWANQLLDRGQICLNDPVLYSTLWESGTLSATTLQTAIEQRKFDIILLPFSEHPQQVWKHHLTSDWQAIVTTANQHYRDITATGPRGSRAFRCLVPR